MSDIVEDDSKILKLSEKIRDLRIQYGLDGLVGGLDHIIINVEEENIDSACQEYLMFTNFNVSECFEDGSCIRIVLKHPESSDIILQARKYGSNPFRKHNIHDKTSGFADTRLESYVFDTKNIERYINVQKELGVHFQSEEPVDLGHFLFIQTTPSEYTGNSIGLIEWRGDRFYEPEFCNHYEIDTEKPDREYLSNIGGLDHAATRVRAKNRDAAILEFMHLTNYDFKYSFFIKSLNSITNVARLCEEDFAMVFTSGIDDSKGGPTEEFMNNYGARTHHLAYNTENIKETVEGLKTDGMDFLLDLTGSETDGLEQIFSIPSPTTFLVNEYIHRYKNFDGFFTKNNVEVLTKATENQ